VDEWMKSLPWKDWGAAVIAGVLAIIGTLVTVGFRAIEGKRLRADQKTSDERKIEHQADVEQTKDLTLRFKALMDGYEGRISDLTAEITNLRGEVRQLRQALESHQNICRKCPYFDEKVNQSSARSTAASSP
jgi:predicted RNase H-like nuclease (RuvC/YqgF family)